MDLRPYQNLALNALYDYLENEKGNPCIVMPTGSGKSLVIATMCKDFTSVGHRVLVVAHRKELLLQQIDKLQKLAPEIRFGVYSAGLNKREAGTQVVVAGIQSVYRKAKELTKHDHIDIVIVDETHLLPAGKDGTGRYHTLINELQAINPEVRLIGLTATPFRTSTGLITDEKNFLNTIVYDVPIKELIKDGYLAPLRSKILPHNKLDFKDLHVRNGEFVNEEVDNLYSDKYIRSAVREFVTYAVGQNRNSVLIFCSGISRAYQTEQVMRTMCNEDEVGVIVGDTLPALRAEMINDFRNKKLKYLISIDVLSTGFDAPNVDLIVMLRPTMSAGLYVQIAGRGSRICEGKTDCVFLDYGGNIERHGAIDCIMYSIDDAKQPKKREPIVYTCTRCYETFEIEKGMTQCPACGAEIPKRAIHEKEQRERQRHEKTASNMSILTEGDSEEKITVVVLDVTAWTHFKRSDDLAPPTVWIKYKTDIGVTVSQFLCLQHPPTSFAYRLAKVWWQAHSKAPIPFSCDLAVEAIKAGKVAFPKFLVIRRQPENKKYFQIVGEQGIDKEAIPIVNPCNDCVFWTYEKTCAHSIEGAGKITCDKYTADF